MHGDLLPLDRVVASRSPDLDSRHSRLPGIGDKEHSLFADHLERCAAGQDETGVEVRDDLVRQRKCRGKADVDAARAERPKSLDPLRLSREQPDRIDAVRADVHQRTAVQFGVEAGVIRAVYGRDVKAEGRADKPQAPDDVRAGEFHELGGLRVVSPHEPLGHDQPALVCAVEYPLDCFWVAGKRLFAEHVFARL
jgi:hypothetical protein